MKVKKFDFSSDKKLSANCHINLNDEKIRQAIYEEKPLNENFFISKFIWDSDSINNLNLSINEISIFQEEIFYQNKKKKNSTIIMNEKENKQKRMNKKLEKKSKKLPSEEIKSYF